MRRIVELSILISVVLISCDEATYTPKPRGYFRIELPEKSYQTYTSTECPFTFEYPSYAKITKDSKYFNEEESENECWMNVVFPTLQGTIYFSYKDVGNKEELVKLIEDAHKMTFKHTIKADYIDETTIKTKSAQGILYEVGGNAASNLQFFLTDTSNHYLRGALYFNTPPNVDSIRPVLDFVKADMWHLIDTFEWTEEPN